jgi:hypothetical protein
MLSHEEREEALRKMKEASSNYYFAAQRIGVHPFIEFTGLMNEYIQACERAHHQGIDFTDCSTHSGLSLPLRPYEVDYINQKLECIFTGRSVMSEEPKGEKSPQ